MNQNDIVCGVVVSVFVVVGFFCVVVGIISKTQEEPLVPTYDQVAYLNGGNDGPFVIRAGSHPTPISADQQLICEYEDLWQMVVEIFQSIVSQVTFVDSIVSVCVFVALCCTRTGFVLFQTHYTMLCDLYKSTMTTQETVSLVSLFALIVYLASSSSSSSSLPQIDGAHGYLYDYVSILAKNKPLFFCAPREVNGNTNIHPVHWEMPNLESIQAASNWLYDNKSLFDQPAMGHHMNELLTVLEPANRIIVERVMISALKIFLMG